MELNQKFAELEAEIKLLKHEVRETLLDIRESILNHENPFTTVGSNTPVPTVVVAQQKLPAVKVEFPEEGRRAVERGGGAQDPDEAQQKEPAARVEFPEESQGAVEGRRAQDPEAQPERTAEKESRGQESGTPAKRPAPLDEVPSLATRHPPLLMTEQRTAGAGAMDMATIAGLGQWAGSGIARIGRKRIEAIVQIYRMMGHLPPGLDEVLIELTHLVECEEPVAQVTMRECIGALVQLDSLLGRNGSSGAALLSLFLDDAAEDTHR